MPQTIVKLSYVSQHSVGYAQLLARKWCRHAPAASGSVCCAMAHFSLTSAMCRICSSSAAFAATCVRGINECEN